MAATGGNGDPPTTAKPPQSPTSLSQPLTRRRRWLYRLAALSLVPTLLLGLLEVSLRVTGCGEATAFFLDGADLERPSVWIDNAAFGRWAFPRRLEHLPQPVPFLLPKTKEPGSLRIFVLGESAAMGFPEPSMSFARVLEVLLRARHPERRVEVLNTAMVAINSHIVLPIARECVRQQPDLLVVHLGNNEVVGPFGAAGVLGPFAPNLGLIRANLALRTTRTGQLLDRLAQRLTRGKDGPQAWQGMEMFVHSQVPADDQRLGGIYANFRTNLEDIAQVAAKAGVPVVFCTVPVNLKDSAPFGSLHDPRLDAPRLANWEKLYQAGIQAEDAKNHSAALSSYAAAEQVDNRYAELAFRLGSCYAALGEMDKARTHYLRARELDTLRFRSDATINATIRSVAAAAASGGARLADAEAAFARTSPGELPGEELFLEHVHMNFHGNYLLARTVCESVLQPPLRPEDGGRAPSAAVILSEDECAARLAYTEWNEWKIAAQIGGQLLEEQPFQSQFDHGERAARWKAKLSALQERLRTGGLEKALAQHEKALQVNPGDWMIRMNYAQLLTETGNAPKAYEQYQQVLTALRHNFTAHYMLGMLQLTMGVPQSAEFHFREALRMAPAYLEAHVGLAEAMERLGKSEQALAVFAADPVRTHPHQALVQAALGRFLYRRGKLDEAKALLNAAVVKEPNNPALHADLGEIAVKQGQIAEAIARYEAALRLQPNWPELSRLLDELRTKRQAGDRRD